MTAVDTSVSPVLPEISELGKRSVTTSSRRLSRDRTPNPTSARRRRITTTNDNVATVRRPLLLVRTRSVLRGGISHGCGRRRGARGRPSEPVSSSPVRRPVCRARSPEFVVVVVAVSSPAMLVFAYLLYLFDLVGAIRINRLFINTLIVLMVTWLLYGDYRSSHGPRLPASPTRGTSNTPPGRQWTGE